MLPKQPFLVASVRATWIARGDNQLTVPQDTEVEIIKMDSQWVWCRYGAAKGWVPKSYLALENIAKGADLSAEPHGFVGKIDGFLKGTGDGVTFTNEVSKKAWGGTGGGICNKSSSDTEGSHLALSDIWSLKLADTMVLHTVQNTRRLRQHIVKMLQGGYAFPSALHIACWQGSTDAVAAVASGSTCVMDWMRSGELTPFHIAAVQGHTDIVEQLMELHAHPDVPTIHGIRALHIAACSNSDIVEVLLIGRANIALTTADADTAIHFACCCQQLATVELLLKAGANASPSNNFGVCPLHIAVAYAALEGSEARFSLAVLNLCAHMADPTSCDLHDETPLGIAYMAGGHTTLIQFLQSGCTRAQSYACELLNRAQISDTDEPEPNPSVDSESLKGNFDEDDVVNDLRQLRCTNLSEPAHCDAPLGQRPRSETAGAILRLSRENGALHCEVSQLQKELEKEQHEHTRSQFLLEQAKNAVSQLQEGSVTSQQRIREVFEVTRSELNEKRYEAVRSRAHLADERKQRRIEKDMMQRRLTTAKEAHDTAVDETRRVNSESKALIAKLNEMKIVESIRCGRRCQASPVTCPTPNRTNTPNRTSRLEPGPVQVKRSSINDKSSSSVEASPGQPRHSSVVCKPSSRMETNPQTVRRASLDPTQRHLSASPAPPKPTKPIGRKAAELRALEYGLGYRTAELEQLRAASSRQTTDLENLSMENSKLSSQLSQKTREHKESVEMLSEIRMQLQQHRDEHAALTAEHQRTEATFHAEEMKLQGMLQEKVMQLEGLERKLSENSEHMQTLKSEHDQLKHPDGSIVALQAHVQELQSAFEAEQTLRKRYHNELQDLKGAVRVYARIRPFIERERGVQVGIRKVDPFSVLLSGKDRRTARSFGFDSVFDEHSTQEDVFSECRGLVGSAVDGFNVTVFAYGQTGSGKTHTMYGHEGAVGLVPRIAEELFQATKSHEAHGILSHVSIRCSMIELYREDLLDLLLPKGKKTVPLEIKKKSRGTVYVENVHERVVSSKEELLKTITDAQDRRHTCATKLNMDSSRSHLIFTITVESTKSKTNQIAIGKLLLCDLAGSERVKKSEATGEQMKEAQSINKSLTALGDVVESLTRNADHVPYRNHKLTLLLSDSIGGTAKTLMFVNCAPGVDSSDETLSSLSYAARLKMIVNKVEKNQDTLEVARLKSVIQVMSRELEQR